MAKRVLMIIIIIFLLSSLIGVWAFESSLVASVKVLLLGDADENCRVDIFDLAITGKCYDQFPVNMCELADVNNDGKVDIFDLATVGKNYGRVC